MRSEQSSRFIVIVDDDRSVQIAQQDLIESKGLSTRCFGSAEQFLDSGAQHKAACLTADIHMPGTSGLELQTKLMAERCRIPIIFTTAHGDPKMRTQAMRDGALAAMRLEEFRLPNETFLTRKRNRMNRSMARTGPVKDGYTKFLKDALLRRCGD